MSSSISTSSPELRQAEVRGDRVGLFLPTLAGGGAERIFLVLAEGFRDRGLQVDLVLAQASGPLLGEVPEAVRVVDLGRGRVLTSPGPLASYLRRERPAGLLTALTHANLIALAAAGLARADTRIVVTEHNNLTSTQRSSDKWQDRAKPWAMRRLYPRAASLVAVSHGVADDLTLRAGLAREDIAVVYNPLRFDAIRERAREQLAVDLPPGDGPLIAGVGSLTEQKDFATLLEAVARVRAERPCRLVIAGEGPERPRLEALIGSLGLEDSVRLAGFVANPYPLFAAADVFALSSRWEGLPTVLLEALSLGTAVVSTNCPNGPEEILRGGELGTLVPVADPDGLARALLEAADGEGRRAPFDESPYRLDTAVDRYLELLGVPA